MMGNYAAYPSYKDSGIEWLGEIPEHWEAKRLKFIATKIQTGTTPSTNDEKYFQDGSLDWFAPSDFSDNQLYLKEAKKKLNFSVLTDKIVKKIPKGSVLIIGIGATLGKVGLLEIDATSNQQINAVHLDSRNNPSYIGYCLFVSQEIMKIISNATTLGILNQDKTKQLPLAIPPLDEQRAIAAFLDYKTQQIDQLIAKKEALLEKLDEKRTALISHAVTKGLDPTVPMKDSGVEWLGEIPAHWNLKKLKFVVSTIIDAEHKTATYDENGDYLVVRTTNVRSGKLLLEGAKFTNVTTYREWTVRAIPEEGDILFTREAPAGEACLVPDKPTVCLGQRMVLFKFDKNKYDGYFLLKSLYSGIADEFIKSLSLGSTVAHFNMSDIACIPLFIPPFSEQKRIGKYLEEQTKIFDDQIEKVKKGIDLLKEYRTALITNAVTGKIDVRSVPIPTP